MTLRKICSFLLISSCTLIVGSCSISLIFYKKTSVQTINNNSELTIDNIEDNDCDLFSNYVKWGETTYPKEFCQDDCFALDSKLEKSPQTFEATLKLDNTFVDRGGVIFGNYGENCDSAINFEIYSDGHPRLYYWHSFFGEKNTVFDNVKINTGEKVHIAIVNDFLNNQVTCYVNGEVKQKIYTKIETIIPTNEIMVGGDYRCGNTQFFKGQIYNFAIFSSVRTSEEVLLDESGVEVESSDLLMAFDLSNLYKQNDVLSLNGKYTLLNKGLWTDYVARPDNFDYSFAIVGDTQIMNYLWPDNFSCIYDFILEKRISDKIACYLGLGDITDKNSDEEWTRARNEINRMNNIIPYVLNKGNHDGSEKYNEYFSSNSFYKTSMDGFFCDDKIENAYKILNVFQRKYLIFSLDYGPSDEVLKWVEDIIIKNLECTKIITTHSYLCRDGTTLDENDVCPPSKSGGVNNGDQMWEKLISKYDIEMVICGHDPSQHIVISREANANGFIVNQILINPQDIDMTDSKGMVALFYFSNNGKRIDIRYYSTVRKKWLKEDSEKFINLN